MDNCTYFLVILGDYYPVFSLYPGDRLYCSTKIDDSSGLLISKKHGKWFIHTRNDLNDSEDDVIGSVQFIFTRNRQAPDHPESGNQLTI